MPATAYVQVFRFQYWDPRTRKLVMAPDHATASMIGQLGGVIVPGSGKAVNAAHLTRSGLLRTTGDAHTA